MGAPVSFSVICQGDIGTMKWISLLFLIIPFNVLSDILWKPELISFELKQSHKLMGKGLILELNQELALGEQGWKQSRIDVPENWETASLQMRKGTIFIICEDGEFFVNSKNKGKLSFAILDGGKKDDKALLQIWIKHASGI